MTAAINVNKFATLNMMQNNCKKMSDMGECWELKVTCKMGSLIRSRVVAFIRKIEGEYVVTLTSKVFKSFMAALASLFDEYVTSFQKLVMAMACPVGERLEDWQDRVNAAVCEILGGSHKVERPSRPTYDRGDKKEALHPLRRAVTKFFGGKYER